MKTEPQGNITRSSTVGIFAIKCWCSIMVLALVLFAQTGRAVPAPTGPTWLNAWTFSPSNYFRTYYGTYPLTYTNLSASDLGDGLAAVIDSTNTAWLQYCVTETNGTNNLRVDQGSVAFWFAPSWSSTNEGGTGPGQWGRLIETGSYTTNASYGWWSLYVDPDGMNIYFGGQTNDGSGATYLSAPIDWTTNRWHFIVLTYSSTNSVLYLDGVIATNGSGVTYQPGADVLTNGFWIGSDSYGIAQARGMFDDMSTYNYQLDIISINYTFGQGGIYYYMNPANQANFAGGSSNPSSTIGYYNAITGSGSLQFLGTAGSCTSSTNIWITNVVAAVAGNGTMNVTFTIEGGSNGVPYDVFANSALVFGTNAAPWSWMGQGYQCNTYMLTNFPNVSTNIANVGVFLILGKPKDTDGDGLTDAYEQLVSKTNPNSSDSDGDGLSDAWEVLLGLNPLISDNAQSSNRSNYTYDPTDWLNTISGARTGSVSLDAEGNVLSVSQ